MSHAYHDALPGFDERQIWKDGCDECELRGQSLPASLGYLDTPTFIAAWRRAAEHNRDGDIGRISEAEGPLLSLLWNLQILFQRANGLEIGRLP
jgi:hypothetical protein